MILNRVRNSLRQYGLTSCVATVLRSPRQSLQRLRGVSESRLVQQSLVRMVSQATCQAEAKIQGYLEDLRSDIQFWAELQSGCRERQLDQYDRRCGHLVQASSEQTLDQCRLHAVAWYLVMRAVKPEKVVETGVYMGWSSALILRAMEINGRGELFSVDMPATKDRPFYDPDAKGILVEHKLGDESEVGALVPRRLHSHWKLMLCRSKEGLPRLLEELRRVEVFIHDSDHSYENMIWEFETALPRVRCDGYILSDNIDWNFAFGDFAGRHKELQSFDERDYLPPYLISGQSQIVGILALRKSASFYTRTRQNAPS